ncbi:MAG: carbohydrate binding domain-containing protein [Acholeplasmataceae bacterium]
MKKIMVLMLLLFLTGCNTNKDDFIWEGLEEKVIIRGDDIDLLEGISVLKKDKDLSDKIVVKDDDEISTHLAGGYTVTYEVTDDNGKKSEAKKTFIVQVGHNVANGNFELDRFGWTLDVPGGQATMNVENGKMNIEIGSSGTAWWAIQLKQENVVFQAGKVYKLTVQASSPEGHSLAAGYEDPNNGFRMLNPGFQTMKLNETMQTYEMYYRAAANFSNVKVAIYLGHMLPSDKVVDTHHITIEKIYIEEVTVKGSTTFSGYEPRVQAGSGSLNTLDPLEGVSVKHGTTDITNHLIVLGEVPKEIMIEGSYYITYLIKFEDGSVSYSIRRFDMVLSKDHPYEVVNGDFDLGFTGWIQDVNQTNGTGKAEFIDNEDGTVSILVSNVSSAGWHIQLQQASSQLKQGETYTVKLIIKASEERQVDLEVVDPSSGFSEIAPTLKGATVETEWTTLELTFTADKDYGNAKVGLLLGNVDGLQMNNITVIIDYFQVILEGK